MNMLLDACVPRPLREHLTGCKIRTAQEMGWGQLKNGDLLRAAEKHFDVLVTSDKNLKHQQNLAGRKLAILVLPTNDWTVLRAKAGIVLSALQKLGPGECACLH
jgi:predicted nuclease of predicted toxin-antitoxin system